MRLHAVVTPMYTNLNKLRRRMEKFGYVLSGDPRDVGAFAGHQLDRFLGDDNELWLRSGNRREDVVKRPSDSHGKAKGAFGVHQWTN